MEHKQRRDVQCTPLSCLLPVLLYFPLSTFTPVMNLRLLSSFPFSLFHAPLLSSHLISSSPISLPPFSLSLLSSFAFILSNLLPVLLYSPFFLVSSSLLLSCLHLMSHYPLPFPLFFLSFIQSSVFCCFPSLSSFHFPVVFMSSLIFFHLLSLPLIPLLFFLPSFRSFSFFLSLSPIYCRFFSSPLNSFFYSPCFSSSFILSIHSCCLVSLPYSCLSSRLHSFFPFIPFFLFFSSSSFIILSSPHFQYFFPLSPFLFACHPASSIPFISFFLVLVFYCIPFHFDHPDIFSCLCPSFLASFLSSHLIYSFFSLSCFFSPPFLLFVSFSFLFAFLLISFFPSTSSPLLCVSKEI